MRRKARFFIIMILIIFIIGISMKISSYLSYSIIQKKSTEDVNLGVTLDMIYIPSDEHPFEEISYVKVHSIELLFSERDTKMVFRFRFLDYNKEYEDSLKEKGSFRLRIYDKNEFFQIGKADVFFSPQPYDDSRYIPLHSFDSKSVHCSKFSKCFVLRNVEIHDNEFIIVAKLPSILQNNNLREFVDIIPDYKKLTISLSGSSLVFAKEDLSKYEIENPEYIVKISLPSESTLIYYTYPVEKNYYNDLGMKTLELTIRNEGFSGEMKFYPYDVRLFVAVAALIFAMIALSINLLLKIYDYLDKKDISVYDCINGLISLFCNEKNQDSMKLEKGNTIEKDNSDDILDNTKLYE